MWKILKETIKNKRTYLIVECLCGYTGERRKDFVLSGRSTECKSCSAKHTTKNTFQKNSFFNKNHKGIGILSRTKFGTYKFGAKKRDIEFNISIEDAYSVWTGKCALSGVILDKTTLSLDRIDSSLGYIVGNIQWVHKDINYMKQELSDSTFIKWCSLVHANQQPSATRNSEEPGVVKVQRLDGEETITHPRAPDTYEGDDIV
jgi:hypothetical protein